MNIPVESILHCQILGNEAKGTEAPFLLHVFHACPHELMPGNTFYARVSGLRQEELNAGELEFLKLSLACTDIDTLLRREGWLCRSFTHTEYAANPLNKREAIYGLNESQEITDISAQFFSIYITFWTQLTNRADGVWREDGLQWSTQVVVHPVSLFSSLSDSMLLRVKLCQQKQRELRCYLG